MSKPIWFGIEWEIALSGIAQNGSPAALGDVLDGIDSALVTHVKHVFNHGSGWWLGNGSKFYRDASESGQAHDEYCSPEVCDPDELLRHDRAGERLVLGLSDLLVTEDRFRKVTVSKANVCPTAAVSWGSHESYEAGKPVPTKPMLAWLASRIALTGSGGLDVRHPGIRPTLSPRAHFIECAVSNQTQVDRGLHNLGKGADYGQRHRVHVVAGDGNRAPLSTWLRFATTALVVRMLDDEKGPPVELAQPVEALHAFALDPEMKAQANDAHGTPESALSLQGRFLESARHITADLPKWAPRVLDEWQRILETLGSETSWRGLVGQLDWPTKLAMFERILERRGWTWERVDGINRKLDDILERIAQESRREPEIRNSRTSPPHHKVMELAAEEMGTNEIAEFVDLRRQLAVVDARYMELGSESLFDHVSVPVPALDRLPLDDPSSPLKLPLPKSGRAKVRAKLVRKHGWKRPKRTTKRRRNTNASWTHFRADGKFLPMPDVAKVDTDNWKDVSEHVRTRGGGLRISRETDDWLVVCRATRIASMGLDSGNYTEAWNALSEARRVADVTRGHEQAWYWKQTVRILARRQGEDDLPGAMERLRQVETERMEWLWEACNCRTWLGLAGHHSVPALAELVRNEMAGTNPRLSGVACWKSHLAYWLNRHCLPTEALELLESTLEKEYPATTSSVQVRIKTQLGEASRMLGDLEEAARHFDEAGEITRRASLEASLIDFVQTGEARLLAQQGDRAAAARLLLEKVLPRQREREMPNLIRTRLMLARLLPPQDAQITRAEEREAIKEDVLRYSGLSNCPLMARILGHFDAWCEGEPDPEPPEGAEVSDLLWGI